jgi:hypothetical protein
MELLGKCTCYKKGCAFKKCTAHAGELQKKDSSDICRRCETDVFWKRIETCQNCKKERCDDCMDSEYCLDCAVAITYGLFNDDN